MAATNYTPISLYYSSTATNTPSAGNLVLGELAINIADGKLFYKNPSNVVTLLASSAGVVPSPFTANGVVYASSTSALTTGSALTFNGTNLVTTGSATGTAFIPSGSTVPTNGMYLPSTNTVAWSTNTTERMRLDSSGNLGIGTSSPGAKLEVNGKIYGNGTVAGDVIANFVNASSTGYGLRTAAGGSDAGHYLAAFNNSSGTNLMLLDGVGNLGLGVTPSAWGNGRVAFQLKSNGALYSGDNLAALSSNAYDDGSFRYMSTNAASLYENRLGQHAWYTAPSGTAGNAITFTQAMTLDASGNLGIGTSSPTTSKLHLKQTTNAQGLKIEATSNDSQLLIYNNNGEPEFRVVATYGSTGSFQPITFWTSDTKRMTLDASGKLLVGYTTSQVAGALLQVNSSVVATGYVIRSGTGGSYGPNSFNINFSSPNVQLWIDTTNLGNITIVSDYRLKENVAAVSSNAISRVMQLNPIQFNRKEIGIFKGSNAIEEGFLAHELQAVIPSSVHGEKDALTEDGGIQPQSLNWSPIVATLVKAMQEQQAMIQSLTDRIAQLEAK